MKKMMDPVLEAERIIEAYVGGKTLMRRQVKKSPHGKTVLWVTGGAGILLATAILFYL